MKSLVTVSRDSDSLLTLDEAKKWLRVEGTEEDALIAAIMKGAVSYAENYLNKTVGNNTYHMAMDSFESAIQLLRPPVNEVTKIEYVDTEGVLQEFDLLLTKLDKDSGKIYLNAGESWPDIANEPFAVHIYYTCTGMFAASEADDVLDAIKLTLTYRYDYRDDPNQRWRKASDNILTPLRIIPFE